MKGLHCTGDAISYGYDYIISCEPLYLAFSYLNTITNGLIKLYCQPSETDKQKQNNTFTTRM